MELTLTFIATGLSIIMYTIWRARRLGTYSNLTKRLFSEFDISDLDNSGNTAYTNCTSHKWVMDNLGRKKHGKFGNILQEKLFDNTLTTFIWIAFVLGTGALIIGIILVRSIEAAGMSIFVIFIGVVVILGPGDTKVSEELLVELSSHDIQNLCSEDYVYAQLALDSVRKWLITAFMIGITIIAISPWADLIPMGIAFVIATITTYIIWNPALVLSEIYFPLSIIYLSIVIPLIGYSIVVVIRRIRRSRDVVGESSVRW